MYRRIYKVYMYKMYRRLTMQHEAPTADVYIMYSMIYKSYSIFNWHNKYTFCIGIYTICIVYLKFEIVN